jgi:hypothetical protein
VSDEDTYRAYGLTVRSDLPLPELRAVDTTRSPDVAVRTGDVEARLAAAAHTLRFDSMGTFAVVDGREVVCDLDSPELRGHRYVRRVVYTKALPVALLQRGAVVVHASAVVVDGRAAIFLGSPDAGKSTTAAAFHRAGYRVIADDIVGIEVEDGPPAVLPGVPQLRLDAAVVAALGVEAPDISNRSGSENRYLNLPPVAESVPLGGLYTLVEGESVGVDPVAGADQFFRVVERTFHDGSLSGADVTPTGFEQVAAVVDSAPVRALRRPTRYDALPSVVDRVVCDLAADDSGVA